MGCINFKVNQAGTLDRGVLIEDSTAHVALLFAHLFTISFLEHLTEHVRFVIVVQETKGEVLWEHLWTLKQLPEDL